MQNPAVRITYNPGKRKWIENYKLDWKNSNYIISILCHGIK